MEELIQLLNNEMEEKQVQIEVNTKRIDQIKTAVDNLINYKQKIDSSFLFIEVSDLDTIKKVVEVLKIQGAKEVHVKHIAKLGIKGLKHDAVVTRWMENMIGKYGTSCPWRKPDRFRQVFTLRWI